MILLPWFSSATLTSASNPKKGQALPHTGFTETCVWGTSRSTACLWSLKQLPKTHGWIVVCWSPQGTHTSLGADGSCTILLLPHQALGPIPCVQTTLPHAVPDFCSEPVACSPPSRTPNQQPGFLLKANHYYNFYHFREREARGPVLSTFLFPWDWLLLVSFRPP